MVCLEHQHQQRLDQRGDQSSLSSTSHGCVILVRIHVLPLSREISTRCTLELL